MAKEFLFIHDTTGADWANHLGHELEKNSIYVSYMNVDEGVTSIHNLYACTTFMLIITRNLIHQLKSEKRIVMETISQIQTSLSGMYLIDDQDFVSFIQEELAEFEHLNVGSWRCLYIPGPEDDIRHTITALTISADVAPSIQFTILNDTVSQSELLLVLANREYPNLRARITSDGNPIELRLSHIDHLIPNEKFVYSFQIPNTSLNLLSGSYGLQMVIVTRHSSRDVGSRLTFNFCSKRDSTKELITEFAQPMHMMFKQVAGNSRNDLDVEIARVFTCMYPTTDDIDAIWLQMWEERWCLLQGAHQKLLPTLLHLVAYFDLRSLRDCLCKAEAAVFACGVRNRNDLDSCGVAEQRGNTELADRIKYDVDVFEEYENIRIYMEIYAEELKEYMKRNEVDSSEDLVFPMYKKDDDNVYSVVNVAVRRSDFESTYASLDQLQQYSPPQPLDREVQKKLSQTLSPPKTEQTIEYRPDIVGQVHCGKEPQRKELRSNLRVSIRKKQIGSSCKAPSRTPPRPLPRVHHR